MDELTQPLVRAIQQLDRERRPMARAFADQRNISAQRGEAARAEFFNELAVLLATVPDLLADLEFVPFVEVVGVDRPGDTPAEGDE